MGSDKQLFLLQPEGVDLARLPFYSSILLLRSAVLPGMFLLEDTSVRLTNRFALHCHNT